MKSTAAASAFLVTILVFISGAGYPAVKLTPAKSTSAKPGTNRSASFAMAYWAKGTASMARC